MFITYFLVTFLYIQRPDFHIEHLTKTYTMGQVQVQALRDVNLDLHAGELAVILGASGSGKSTLLNIIGALDTPTSGSVRYGDLSLTNASDKTLTLFRREHIGFVFQFYNLIPSLTALENVQLVTDVAINPMTAEDALKRVGLADRLYHFPSQLSGGEQQRIAIARAIAKRPDILLCDEPTGALDYTTGITVLDVLKNIHDELGTTTVIITHNASIAEMADRVIHMSSGEVISVVTNTTKLLPSELRW